MEVLTHNVEPRDILLEQTQVAKRNTFTIFISLWYEQQQQQQASKSQAEFERKNKIGGKTHYQQYFSFISYTMGKNTTSYRKT